MDLQGGLRIALGFVLAGLKVLPDYMQLTDAEKEVLIVVEDVIEMVLARLPAE